MRKGRGPGAGEVAGSGHRGPCEGKNKLCRGPEMAVSSTCWQKAAELKEQTVGADARD